MSPAERADLVLAGIEIVGTLAFALSGFIEATRKRMDIVGIATVAFVAALGGGTLRDILLDRRPFFWVERSGYVWLILVLTVVGLVLMRARHIEFTGRAMRWPDALGLGLFSVVGAGQAIAMEQPLIVAALMGVVTAVFGGVMRDILCNEVPTVFRDHRPYAVCAFAGAWTFIAFEALAAPAWIALSAGIAVAAGWRMLALVCDWRVPGWTGR
jgi:uncharacterized membrane protein YeiH